jgi:hypothetical protein
MRHSFLATTSYAGVGRFAPMTARGMRPGLGTPTTQGLWVTTGPATMGAAQGGSMINPVVQDHTAPTRRRR